MGSPTSKNLRAPFHRCDPFACMLSNMKPKTQNAVRCAAYQGRKREQDAATDRRRTTARTLRQSKRKPPANPADELVEWCKRRLKVPAGHGLAGKVLALPAFVVDFLRDALQPSCHTGWLLVGRKNGKSQGLASWCWPTWLTAGRFAVLGSVRHCLSHQTEGC